MFYGWPAELFLTVIVIWMKKNDAEELGKKAVLWKTLQVKFMVTMKLKKNKKLQQPLSVLNM